MILGDDPAWPHFLWETRQSVEHAAGFSPRSCCSTWRPSAFWSLAPSGCSVMNATPLAGVFLIPLGLPWNLPIDPFPEALYSWLAAGAARLNPLAIWLIGRAIPADRSPATRS